MDGNSVYKILNNNSTKFIFNFKKQSIHTLLSFFGLTHIEGMFFSGLVFVNRDIFIKISFIVTDYIPQIFRIAVFPKPLSLFH